MAHTQQPSQEYFPHIDMACGTLLIGKVGDDGPRHPFLSFPFPRPEGAGGLPQHALELYFGIGPGEAEVAHIHLGRIVIQIVSERPRSTFDLFIDATPSQPSEWTFLSARAHSQASSLEHRAMKTLWRLGLHRTTILHSCPIGDGTFGHLFWHKEAVLEFKASQSRPHQWPPALSTERPTGPLFASLGTLSLTEVVLQTGISQELINSF